MQQTQIPALSNAATPAQCRQWLTWIVREIGPGFHPDTRGDAYLVEGSERASLNAANAARLDAGLDVAFATLGDAVYDLCVDSALATLIAPVARAGN
jgi:hypothetical protein